MLIRRNSRRPAATLVETAAVIVVFVLLLFGLFEYGRFIMTRQLMQNAAREGARWAVVHTYNGSIAQIQDHVDFRLDAARNQLVGYDKTVSIRVYAADADGNEIAGKDWDDAAFGEGVAVEITGTYRPILPSLLFLDTDIAVSAKAVMSSEAN